MDSRRFHEILTRECRIKGNKPLIVGVSGGADSLCLLSLLSSEEMQIIVAHFDHQLRPESHQDLLKVAEFAEYFRCEFISGKEDVRDLAQQEGLSLEAAARTSRYRFLFDQAHHKCAEAVLVAHTADDQVETILMHIIRGSGLEGLKGMRYRSFLPSYSTEIPLIRPLLGYWRAEIERYCQEHGLLPLEDLTNLDKRFTRNRLRHELVPQLETYNPKIKKRVWSLGNIAQSSLNDLDSVSEWIYKRCVIEDRPGEYVVFNNKDLSELPDGLFTKILRIAIGEIHSNSVDINYLAVKRALRLVRKSSETGQVDLTSNLVAVKFHKRVYITERGYPIPTSNWPQITSSLLYELFLGKKLNLGEGWQIHSEQILYKTGTPIPENPFEAWLDLESFQGPLGVRSWREGDRFQPLGMSGKIKISDFFTNQKIPRPARSRWPLVTCGNEIVWVAGLRISEKYRVKENTQQVVHLKLVRR